MNNDLINYGEFLNEEMSAVATKKLRDAIHDIVVELKLKETLDVEELSNALLTNGKITISPFFIDKFLGDFMRVKGGDKRATTIFTRGDTRWLGVRDNKGTKEIRNNLLYQKPSLAKHKRRLYSEEESEKLERAYKEGMKDLNFNEDVMIKSLIFQRPEDSKDMIKLIYSDVVVNKKYYNTYENCWKLMISYSKRENLDRIRGYFKLAPQSVKEEYKKTGKFNLDLKLIEKPKSTTKKPVSTKSNNHIENNNMLYLEEKINKYSEWIDFINNINLLRLVNLINGMNVVSKHSEFEIFLSKLDELVVNLKKYYGIKEINIIDYFKEVKLAKYIRDWKTSGIKPKISDF